MAWKKKQIFNVYTLQPITISGHRPWETNLTLSGPPLELGHHKVYWSYDKYFPITRTHRHPRTDIYGLLYKQKGFRETSKGRARHGRPDRKFERAAVHPTHACDEQCPYVVWALWRHLGRY